MSLVKLLIVLEGCAISSWYTLFFCLTFFVLEFFFVDFITTFTTLAVML